jgi:RHS repeat-associated protein
MNVEKISQFGRRPHRANTSGIVSSLVLCALGTWCLATRAEAQSAPAPYLTAHRYIDGGLLAGTISPAPSGQSNFLATRYWYDPNERLQKVESGYLTSWPGNASPYSWGGFVIGKTITYSYDGNGRKVAETVTGNDGNPTNVTQYDYDAYDRVTCTAVRMNAALFASRPASACTGTQGANVADRITKNTYDSLNRVIQIRKAVGVPPGPGGEEAYATYSYTDDGLRQSVTDANGNKSTLTYDGLDRQTRLNFPSPTAAGTASSTDYESYGYDNNGNRTSLTTRQGDNILYQYDALNRMTLKDVPGTTNDVYYGYDLRGLQTYALFGSTSGPGITNHYDGFGHLTSTINTMGGVSRTVGHLYDADGDRTQVVHPDNSYFVYTYDGLDRLSSILENGGTAVVGQSYNPYGLRSGQTRGAVASSYLYDPAERLQNWTDDLLGAGPDITTTFAYNPANQIITRTISNSAYTYSGYTNVTRSYTPNGLNQYSNVAGTGFTYWGNGNLWSDGANTYTYDVENRLLTASGAHSATLTYDPLGRLFQIVAGSTTTQFLYDGDELVAEYNGSGVLQRRYVHGTQDDDPLISYEGSSVSAAARRSLQANYQGSIVSVADASGDPITIDRYDEYGLPAGSNAGRFQYTGQAWLPEVGVYYYKARIYDPRLGRFLQTDPVGYQDDLNLYAYVGSDPLDHTDPSGKCLEDACIGEAILVAGAASIACDLYCADVANGIGNLVGAAAQGAKGVYDAVRGLFNEAKPADKPTPNKESPPAPGQIVGTPPNDVRGNRTNSGPLAPEHGGTGDSGADFDHLTGGNHGPAPADSSLPEGSRVGENGVILRPPKGRSGTRIDIPAAGDKPHETLHYPPPPPPAICIGTCPS